MAEYIERERLRELLKDHYFPTDQEYESDRKWAVGFNAGLDKALHKIHYAPAADVAPVVHGRWEEYDRFVCNSDGKPVAKIGVAFVCSLCGREAEVKEPYCHCGARMDGDTHET